MARLASEERSGVSKASTTLVARVTSRAKRNDVSMGREGEAIVRVRAPAIDGRANEAVIAALADRLGVRRSQISLVRGATSRQKILVVEGLDAVQVRTRLQRPSAE